MQSIVAPKWHRSGWSTSAVGSCLNCTSWRGQCGCGWQTLLAPLVCLPCDLTTLPYRVEGGASKAWFEICFKVITYQHQMTEVFPEKYFLPLLSSFLVIYLPLSEGDAVHTKWLPCPSDNHRVYGGRKAMSHFLLFCSKLAGVSYLSRTEILVLRKWGVPAIASFTVISFRLIHSKVCNFCSNSC